MLGPSVIKGPIGVLIGLVVWMVANPLLVGAMNGWFVQTVNAGTVNGERFDRVLVVADTHNSSQVNDAWKDGTLATSTENAIGAVSSGTTRAAAAATGKIFTIVLDGTTGCKLGADVAPVASTTLSAGTAKAITPIGTTVALTRAEVAAGGSNTPTKVTGCTYSPAQEVFQAGGFGGLVTLILQAAVLGPPIGLLFALSTFGSSMMRDTGVHPILAAILMAIVLLLASSLLNTILPFLTTAFNVLDADRFVALGSGLGTLSRVISNFYGIVIVAGMLSIGFQVIGHIRGRNAITASQRM